MEQRLSLIPHRGRDESFPKEKLYNIYVSPFLTRKTKGAMTLLQTGVIVIGLKKGFDHFIFLDKRCSAERLSFKRSRRQGYGLRNSKFQSNLD